jgi:hypothetical protein
VQSEELKHWIIATGLDTVTVLFVLAAALLIASALGVMFTTRARRRQERQKADGPTAPESAPGIGIARWIEEGRHLFGLWQEQVERLTELQGRLAATALEIDQLRAQVIRLSQERDAASLERDYLRSILARIDDLIQRASEAGLGATAPNTGITQYPTRPMDTASARITDKLWHGTLPAEDPAMLRGGKGSGLRCHGCDIVISPSEREYEVEMPGGSILRFHVACCGLWRVLVRALPPAS